MHWLIEIIKIRDPVYVKHIPDKVVIENPGGFPEGITQNNIIFPSICIKKQINSGDTATFKICSKDRAGSGYYL